LYDIIIEVVLAHVTVTLHTGQFIGTVPTTSLVKIFIKIY